MPNGKVREDLLRIIDARKKLTLDTATLEQVDAILEVAYQLAMLRGDIADMMDLDNKACGV